MWPGGTPQNRPAQGRPAQGEGPAGHGPAGHGTPGHGPQAHGPHGAPPPGPGPWGGPGTPGPLGTQRPEPDPAAVRATSRRLLHFGVLLLAAVLTSALPLPGQIGSLVFVVAAIVVGIHALVQAWRAGIRGAILPVLALGVASAGLIAVTVLSLLVVWPQQMQRQTCLATAVTISGTERCEADFRRAVEDRLESSLSPAGS
jgi:hypothetical protein